MIIDTKDDPESDTGNLEKILEMPFIEEPSDEYRNGDEYVV